MRMQPPIPPPRVTTSSMMATRTVIAVMAALAVGGLIQLPLLASASQGASRVATGADRLASNETLRDSLLVGRTGIISNPTGVLPNLTHFVDFLASKIDVDLVSIYGPEHGFRGDHQAGQGGAGMYIDNQTHLPVYSLYQKEGQALADVLNVEKLDTLVYDIQDVGTRFYTFIWTLFDVMSVLPLTTITRLVVLDRPNPINATIVQGPVLQPEFASFIGRYSIPQRHGMTTAELALLFYDALGLRTLAPSLSLECVTMQNYHRAMLFSETGLPWVAPSPNMPTQNTAMVYAGIGILEGTNLSEGRGTTTPFNLFGAGFFNFTITSALWSAATTGGSDVFAGALLREAFFIPTFSKFQGNITTGCELFVTDVASFQPIAWGLQVVATALKQYPQYTVIADDDFDLHMGNNATRLALQQGMHIPAIVDSWQQELQQFRAKREKYLLYT